MDDYKSGKSTPMHDSFCQTSYYSKIVDEQNRMQPTYGNLKEIENVGGGVRGAHRNEQKGP